MKLTVLLVVTVAMLLLFAIYLREDVKFTVRFLGTDLSLEVKDHPAGRDGTLSQGHEPAVTRGEGDTANVSSQSE